MMQDAPAEHLKPRARTFRRRATDLVAEAWQYLEDNKTSSSKIIPLLFEAAKLIQPADVPGQMLFKLPKPIGDEAPGPPPRRPKSLWHHPRTGCAVYSLDEDGNRQEYESINKASASGDSYPCIQNSIYRGSTTRRGFRWFYVEATRPAPACGDERQG